MIRQDKDREQPPSEEEIKRQDDDVRSVVQYCQNVVDCRRVQLLGYFGETFDSKECHKSCDNCVDGTEVIRQDVSSAAVDAIRLVKSLTQADKAKTTQIYCSDVFRGANLKEIRERKHDRHPLYGSGRKISREMVDRLFAQLLVVDAFRLVSVQNNSGWHNNYLEVSPHWFFISVLLSCPRTEAGHNGRRVPKREEARHRIQGRNLQSILIK